ncbi:putative transcriptional activator [Vibrio ichthyoenteri ATCC 700023]|uniref:Putative transcriptional activator n=1 Tax=Vibrio ichthyoenteri ATCC 700023 TaxID=870968 RepID=F9S0V5_9VIBR|nr:ChrR family anti-sigma-E factor [Vibrio ichthyoenteri]EGU42938.1 putative transcriptional activator [Vibrio ichthyoenteri ATCC 700023]
MSYHPKIEMLQAYVQGALDEVDGFALATHIESCPACQRHVAQFEDQAGLELELAPIREPIDLSDLFEQIVALEPCDEPIRVARKPRVVEVNGRRFTLPLTLSRFSDNIGEWRSYGGKVFSAPVELVAGARVNLLYIAAGVQIPQHTHKGMESTLVLHGSFSDEDGEYYAGDYLLKDGTTKHSPFTKAGEDCLCLTFLTEPMLFTQGVARIFNRFGKGLYP